MIKYFLSTLTCALCCLYASAQQQYNAIYSGIPWFDDHGQTVSAHGAGIIKDKGRYYLFGEKHSDTSNVFVGFNCYSSTDLYNWRFESTALTVQDTGRLGPNRVGERVKVMKCPQTGEYIMLMHTDNAGYKDPCTGYATAKNITGPYTFRGPLLFNGAPIRKWDMGVFQDSDGSGYLLIHGGLAYKLSADYHSITELTVDNKWPGSEAPAVFKRHGVYYWLTSHLSSWERNDNYYYTAPSMKGPWTSRGIFAPQGTLTWNSQTTFVLPVAGASDTTYLFMGDRWSYPHQASSATYVWQPITFSGDAITIPAYQEAWLLDTQTGIASMGKLTGKTILHTNQQTISYKGQWQHLSTDTLTASRSNTKGDSFEVKFNGTRIGFYGLSGPMGGYARIRLTNAKGKVVLSSMADTYSKYPVSGLLFLSPTLPKGNYILTVSVCGEHGMWTDKSKTVYGSKGDFVAVQKVIVN